MTGRALRSPLAAAVFALLAAAGCGGTGRTHGEAVSPASRAAPTLPESPTTPEDELQSRRPFGRAYTHRHCTQGAPCRFVVRLGATSSQHRFIAWDTPERYARGAPLFIQAWADEQPVPFQLMGSPACGLHFTLRAVVVGVAVFCSEGHHPIHFQFTNVTQHPVTVTLRYYAVSETPPVPARRHHAPAPKPQRPSPKPQAPKPPAVGPYSPL